MVPFIRLQSEIVHMKEHRVAFCFNMFIQSYYDNLASRQVIVSWG